jgi:hypothetical protein
MTRTVGLVRHQRFEHSWRGGEYRRITCSGRSEPPERCGTWRLIGSDIPELVGSDVMTRHRVDVAGQRAGRRIADLLPHADLRADWRRVRGLFHQQIQLIDGGFRRIPDEITEAFADAVLEISASYAGREEELCEHALAVLADVECGEIVDLDLFRTYYEDDRFTPAPGVASEPRRRSAPYEAIVETCRRLRDSRRLRAACRNTRTSGLLIGSTSYGRFYNVRGNRCGNAASDLDFIVVIEEADGPYTIAEALASLPGVAVSDVDHLVRRARVFADGLDDGRTVFSHKIRLWADGTSDPMLPSGAAPADYLLSLHVMTPPVLDYVLVTSTPRLLKETAGTRRTVRDYREALTARWDHLHDFAGRSHRVELDAVPAEDGCLRSPRVYHIDEFDCYFPGFFQTMLFPQPDLLWDDLDVRPAIDEFQRKLGERVRYEANRREHAMLRPSFAHVRREVFAPSVIKLLDTGYSRS